MSVLTREFLSPKAGHDSEILWANAPYQNESKQFVEDKRTLVSH